jgi:hypothetical protein
VAILFISHCVSQFNREYGGSILLRNGVTKRAVLPVVIITALAVQRFS